MTILARPVTAADGPGLVRLFEAASSPCFCRYLHFEGDKNDWLARCALEPEVNRQELEAGLGSGSDDTKGIVAQAAGAGDIIGWAKLAPAPAVPKAYAQRYYAGIAALKAARESTLLLGCFLVDPRFRRQGVSRALIAAALVEASRCGARFVEALPRILPPPARDEELWTGTVEALVGAGFARVGGDDAYPALRLELGGST